MAAYYNEFDPFAAQWLRNLIVGDHIAPGDVDERSIVDVQADDLSGYTQCHFFAGIGGWSYALRLAGWEDERPVWTGSCPCQPLSSAGKQLGHEDERHLWPSFYHLISEHRPSAIFGEQVASKAGLEWLAAVRADMEGIGYGVGCADLPAPSVGAPHIRQRAWWVANRYINGSSSGHGNTAEVCGIQAMQCRSENSSALSRRSRRYGALADDNPGRFDPVSGATIHDNEYHLKSCGELDIATSSGCKWSGGEPAYEVTGPTGAWDEVEWLRCRDGKARPTQPGLFPLAYGVPSRVGRLRAYGNAIVPQVAAEFIKAYMEI